MNEEISKIKFLLHASMKFLTNSELAVLFGFAGSPNTCGNKHRRGCVFRRCGSKSRGKLDKKPRKPLPYPKLLAADPSNGC